MKSYFVQIFLTLLPPVFCFTLWMNLLFWTGFSMIPGYQDGLLLQNYYFWLFPVLIALGLYMVILFFLCPKSYRFLAWGFGGNVQWVSVSEFISNFWMITTYLGLLVKKMNLGCKGMDSGIMWMGGKSNYTKPNKCFMQSATGFFEESEAKMNSFDVIS